MGNAVTDDYYDYIGTFEYWWTHGLISDTTYKSLKHACLSGSATHPSIVCAKALDAADLEFGNIDPYSIYTRTCNTTSSSKRILMGHYVSHKYPINHRISIFFRIFNISADVASNAFALLLYFRLLS